MIDPSLQSRKPDFTVFKSVKINKKNEKEFLLVTEIKSPRIVNSISYIMSKLGNLMKDSLDKKLLKMT